MRSTLKSFALLAALANVAFASDSEPRGFVEQQPAGQKAAGLDQKLDAKLPLDLTFTDENNQTVRLGDYFHKDRPVILQLGYYGCPMLCTIVSQSMAKSFKEQTLKIGTDYEVVSVSIDPTETYQLAQKKKRSYITEYGRPEEAHGWHFLTGNATNIRALADAVGFKYAWIEDAQQYSHPAALILSTPDGHVSRYLVGVQYDPQTLRLSLVEASKGKIGTISDEFMLTCFMFDGNTGKYAASAMRLMRLGGIVTAGGLGLGLFFMIRRENRRAAAAYVESHAASTPAVRN